MSISSISSASSYQANQVNWQNNSAQRQQDFNALASALNSNNLSAAQSAFAALQQLLPNSSTGTQTQTGQPGSVQNPLAADFSALSKALSSNDLTGAQAAFKQLQADMQSVGGARHRHHHHKASASTQSTPSTTPSSSVGSTAGSSGGTQNASGGSSFSVYA